MIAVIENRDLALGDGFERFIERYLHRLSSPALVHRNGDGGHAVADLDAGAEALAQKGSGWGCVAPNPREIVRGDGCGEQRWMATSHTTRRKKDH
jgi:hypothetical protein